MISADFAERFARDWVDAWNRHDLDAVLSHYAEDFEMSSPYIATIAGEASGRLKGKDAIRAYWTRALATVPDLRFELMDALAGADSVTIYYRGVRGMVAEVFFVDPPGLVTRAFAHYSRERPS